MEASVAHRFIDGRFTFAMGHRWRYSFQMSTRTAPHLFVSLCLVLSLLLSPMAGSSALAASYPLDESDSEIRDALEYLSDQQDSDGGIGGFAVSAWAVMAIAAAGEDPDDSDWEGSSGDTIIEYLENEADTGSFDATDWARMILAIVAAGEDPTDFGGEDYIDGLEDLYEEENETGNDYTQIGDDDVLNDDFWGVLALVAADESVNSDIIEFIEEFQNSDGGWSWEITGDSDVDNTAAAIMALIAAGESSSSSVIEDALVFLVDAQNDDGGFPEDPDDESNAASTSWAIMALEAAGEDPDSGDWEPDSDTPVEYLLSLQDTDGYFEWTDGDDSNSEWMTAYAIPALLGMSYPVESSGSSGSGDPDIEYAPTDLVFRATEGGGNPLDQTFEVWNDGSGTLDWEVSDDAGWLSLGTSSGSSTGEKDDVEVSVDTGGLVAGTYDAITITITSADADNSPQEIDVVLYVTEETTDDEIAVLTDEFEFTAETGDDDPDDQVLEIWNSGPGTITWELDVDCDDDWLDVSPEDGESSGEHDDVSLRVDIAGLDVGDYEATITIESDDADNSPMTIDVTLEMTGDPLEDDPEIDISPDDDIEFEAVEGGDDPDEETLEISNSGEGTLNWSASDDAGWLSISPRSGSLDADENEDIDVFVDLGSLDEGEYEAEITIEDDDASNSPVRIDVLLTVEAAGSDGSSRDGFYQLTVGTNPMGGGTVTRDLLPQASGYAEGSTVTLTATANPGYAFVGWSGDAMGTQNPTTLVMTQNRAVSASFMQFDAAGMTNVSLSYVSPGIGAVSVIPYPVSSIPSDPPGFRLLSAYVVEPQGSGSFSLQFDGLPNTASVAVFTVIAGQWGQMPRSQVGDSSIQVTLSESDSLIALAYPGDSGSGIMNKIKGLFDGGDTTTYIIVGSAAILVIGIVIALFMFVRRDEY